MLEITGNPEDLFVKSLWLSLLYMVQRNKNLEEIRIRKVCTYAPPEFWSAFASCPKLNVVQIIDGKMTAEMADAFWDGCKNIKELIMVGSYSINIRQRRQSSWEIDQGFFPTWNELRWLRIFPHGLWIRHLS